MADIPIENVEGIAAGNQGGSCILLHCGDVSELAGKGGVYCVKPLLALGDFQSNQHRFPAQVGLIIIHSLPQIGSQCLRLAGGGAVERFPGGVIGVLGRGIRLDAIGTAVVGSHDRQ